MKEFLYNLLYESSTTVSPMFVIQNEQGKEILIPLVDHWIQKVDRENKQILLDLPEGLIDVFLSTSPEEKS